jgi:ABC-type Fe3+/spermidine/putrescine transport system ATPase subunit
VTKVNVILDRTRVLRDASLDAQDGEIVGVLGPSGSGKSTLLRAIAGLVEVDSGDIAWDGESIADIPTHRRNFGLMFQGFALFPHLNVEENVAFGLEMAGHKGIEEEVAEALDWVGLRGFQKRQIDGLSGGEKQRVALARTLAPRPQLVMLDEPLGSLDRNLRERLVGDTREILEERSVTAVVVTHDREEAVAMADRLAIMRQGTIVQTGRLEEILDAPADRWVEEFIS